MDGVNVSSERFDRVGGFAGELVKAASEVLARRDEYLAAGGEPAVAYMRVLAAGLGALQIGASGGRSCGIVSGGLGAVRAVCAARGVDGGFEFAKGCGVGACAGCDVGGRRPAVLAHDVAGDSGVFDVLESGCVGAGLRVVQHGVDVECSSGIRGEDDGGEHGSGDGRSREAGGGTDGSSLLVSAPVQVRKPGELPRGPNYGRNQAARRRKAEKKKKERAGGVIGESPGLCVDGVVRDSEESVPEWRRRSGVVDGSQPRGFFSRCDEETRRELRESRAKRLVAENELAAARAKAEVSAMSGVVALVTQLNAVVKTAAQLEKNTSDERVKSWAKTVVDSAISELSEKAPSSVPSLQSVGASSSASQERSAATAASSVSRAKSADDKLFVQLAFEGLDPGNPADAKEINRRTYVRQVAERALRQTAHWQ